MKQPSLHNEDELLVMLKNDREEAFTELFNYYKPAIYDVARRFLQSHALAEEIVQDVFLKVWVKRAEMSAIRNFNAYLFIMARNLIFDRIKKISFETIAKAELGKELFNIDDTEHLVRQHQCQQLLKQSIELLPPQQKIVYQLAKVEGLSHEKIAEKMNLSRLTVKAHMAKALQTIRKYLDAHLNTSPLLPLLAGVLSFF